MQSEIQFTLTVTPRKQCQVQNITKTQQKQSIKKKVYTTYFLQNMIIKAITTMRQILPPITFSDTPGGGGGVVCVCVRARARACVRERERERDLLSCSCYPQL
jgi:hypothetical protein